VHGHLQQLSASPKLGTADRTRLSRHFDEIRDLERQISTLPPVATATCSKPRDPGADSPIGGAQGVNAAGENTYATNLGYSGEEERARMFCDLVHMAFTCDLSRVASLMFTMFQSHMNMYPLTGHQCDCHEVGHGGDPKDKGTKAVSKVIAWHMKHFAYLLGKLRDTPEGTGASSTAARCSSCTRAATASTRPPASRTARTRRRTWRASSRGAPAASSPASTWPPRTSTRPTSSSAP
jgi:hypothetical protein